MTSPDIKRGNLPQGQQEVALADVRDIYVELHIAPEWSRIDPVRQAIGLCITSVFGNNDLQDALGMVCAELLENAIKYGKPDPNGILLLLRDQVRNDQQEIILSIINAVEESSHHIQVLQQRIRWIQTFDSPADAYMAALTMVYERAESQSEGGLGLVRIAYEGGCQLECDSPSDGMMAVHARYRLPPLPNKGES